MSKTLKTKQAKVEALKSEKKNNDLSSQKSEHRNLETEIGRLKELYENEIKLAYCEAKKSRNREEKHSQSERNVKGSAMGVGQLTKMHCARNFPRNARAMKPLVIFKN
ncbi:hypothetical protein HanRHA438_Chr16g0744031 [Helianthus annuus]|nr:hypothetical protein HanRHA438_Chr16g0744031 [Helianthus annuus]